MKLLSVTVAETLVDVALDHVFENVCELDLIFHMGRVHYILDEIVMVRRVLNA